MAKATILVVDDESLIRWSLSERLKSEGYDVVEADTGRAALEQLPEGIDLVLLDYRLPDTDGVSVLRKIKEFDQDILVIFSSSWMPSIRSSGSGCWVPRQARTRSWRATAGRAMSASSAT